MAPRLLTVIPGNAILDPARDDERGFHGSPFGGLFLLRFSLRWLRFATPCTPRTSDPCEKTAIR